MTNPATLGRRAWRRVRHGETIRRDWTGGLVITSHRGPLDETAETFDDRFVWTRRDEVVTLRLVAVSVFVLVGLLIAANAASPWAVVFYVGGVPMITFSLALARRIEVGR